MLRNDIARVLREAFFEVGAIPYAILTSQPAWRSQGAELSALVGARPGSRLLDLGCGPGESAFGMAERVPGLAVTGLDVSRTMLRVADLRRRHERCGSRVTLVHGDAMSLPFPDATFDAVTGNSFLYLVPDAATVLREVARVLVPSGRCAFLEPSPSGAWLPPEIVARAHREPRFVTSMALWRVLSRGYGRFDAARFREVFAEAGLEMESARETLSGIAMIGVARKVGS